MPETLEAWLAHIEGCHARPIELGLQRLESVKTVLRQAPFCPVITVAGTNGKGSTCAMLERILIEAGYRVGLYTSPHLLRYNERVRLNGRAVVDECLCDAFARVEAARGDVPLTYFEFGTLAAWEVFAVGQLDVVILEVGLGGRLDAVNIYPPDCAIVTTVDLDHMDYLGETREEIGFEKAGIFRSGVTAICGDSQPPESLVRYASSIGAPLQVIGRDFGFFKQDQQWQYWGPYGKRSSLAWPGLRGANQLQNASVVLAALDGLRDHLPVAMQDIRHGLLEAELAGRFQVLPGRPTIVLDVAHNPQAARVLAENLGGMAFHPETWAVFGMLNDKDVAAVIDAMRGRVTRWLPCTLQGPRAATAEMLVDHLVRKGVVAPEGAPIPRFSCPADAMSYARGQADEGDRIVVFGSFLTVADALRSLGRSA